MSDHAPPHAIPTTDHLTRTELPETIGSAREWQRIRNAASRDGLCDPDAAAVAWGHAVGFARLTRTPCPECRAIMATFPEETAHLSFRTRKRGRAGAPSTRSTDPGSLPVPPELPPALTGTLEGRRVIGVISTPARVLTGKVTR
ncbi:hypothetical protein O2W15_07385 [Modestobacter sp. VKM Ac-2979]|uniref:hypothetical protein n=1 Tax=unclassified Modestobacter TaxID=2643866 RepID=UPI0022ABC4C4|nr:MULTISPECIES: hypothetical protein [unclassified Modestobacter]MCZ2811259.1 hypothetical protein [Modestobacter sp. VKM Ac-2979]MCZ2840772.1 hypothetical protein [Modestobacter sp. VKM Ac-2980]